jgi:hypothetical protein
MSVLKGDSRDCVPFKEREIRNDGQWIEMQVQPSLFWSGNYSIRRNQTATNETLLVGAFLDVPRIGLAWHMRCSRPLA